MQNSCKIATALRKNFIILYIMKFLSHKIILCNKKKKYKLLIFSEEKGFINIFSLTLIYGLDTQSQNYIYKR
jgi:hypothetical protein